MILKYIEIETVSLRKNRGEFTSDAFIQTVEYIK